MNALAPSVPASVFLTLCLCFSTALGNTALDAALERQQFRYSATYGNDTKVGELRITVQRLENDIEVTATLHVSNALAKLFLKEYSIRNRFEISLSGILLSSGEARRPGNPDVISSYVVDRERGTIRYANQDGIPIPAESVLDTSDFPIMLATSDLAKLEGRDVLVASHSKVSHYIYKAPERDVVTVGGISYDTWKITRSKRGETGRQVTTWLTADARRIPLLIVSTKRGADTVFRLLDPPEPSER